MGGIVKSVVKAVTSIFGGDDEPEPLPPVPDKVEDPKVAPDPDDKQARRHYERKMQTRRQSMGRASTMLDEDDNLG